MIVKELIKELLEYNMDAEVTTSHSETIELSYIGNPKVEDCSDKKQTQIVFIDGCDLEQDTE